MVVNRAGKYAGPERRGVPRESDEIGFKGYGVDFLARGKSTHSLTVLLVVVATGAALYFGWLHDKNGEVRAGEIASNVRTLQKSVDGQSADIRAQSQDIRAMIYVMTLSQAEREKLNLLKPKSLGEMQR